MSAAMPPTSGVTQRFLDSLQAMTTGPLAADELLPTRLMAALAAVLELDGAGLSVLSDIRAPLGASNDHAAAAERLQSTLGDGPCLAAYHQSKALIADERSLQDQWPLYYSELAQRTPFRAVASIPLFTGAARFGAIDVYWSTPHIPGEHHSIDALTLLAPVITTLLTTSPPQAETRFGAPAPAWIDAPPIRARMHVWVAIGLLNATRKLNSGDALALIRAAAYSRNLTIDELSRKLSNREIAVQQITD